MNDPVKEASSIKVRVLGRIDALVANESVSVGSRANERLLALLVAASDDGISLGLASDELWPSEDGPSDRDQTLRTYISRLRSVLGRESIVVHQGIARLQDVRCDAREFEDLVVRARRTSGSPTAGELWADAVLLWRGEVFGSHDDLPSVTPVAVRLRELRAEALEAWFDHRLANGERQEVVADLGPAIEAFPLRERFRAQHMTALADGGRQADALREFQGFRAELTEVGLEPSPDLVDLERRIIGAEPLSVATPSNARDYRMGDRLGEGAFSVVYRAEQTSVGREVAVKQIRSELANRPEFIRLFEAEAHLVASLEHPHIVPLYDFWREPGSAYLVMRYLRGGSLASRILDSPMNVGEVAEVMLQLGDALDEAHSRGVVHRDIKPDNVLLDEDGRAYLSDFGIAVDEVQAANPEAWLSHGSPAYASPEQLRREPVGAASDVHGLGVATFEALTGQLPFPSETTVAALLERQLNEPIPLVGSIRDDVPAAVDAVLQQATAKNPELRHASAGEFAQALALSAGLSVTSSGPTEDRNPYKGLLAYTEADAADFVGRDRLVETLVSAVALNRVVTVVGPSGSGKSSVVRAGLVPAIRLGRVNDSANWWVTTLTPSTAPFASLADAIARVAVSPPPNLATYLREDPRHLAEVLRSVVPDDRELVLVIDQLEELFTLATESERVHFLEAIQRAVTDERTRVRVVQTLRADFYDRPLRHPQYARLIEAGTVPVHPLAADELEQAITFPAQRVGTRFEPGLVARIAADVADQPGALPLLQYTLMRLYDQRSDANMITLAAYQELGGVSGALASQAEESYAQGSAEERAATRRLFGRLVNLGEGTGDTRRRVRTTELTSSPALDEVIDRFGAQRLLAFDRDAATREATLEVAHEAVIGEWPRLRGWLDEDRDGLRVLRHVSETAVEWNTNGKRASDLYRGARLETASEFAAKNPDELSASELDFLRASEDRRADDVEKERRQLRRLRTTLAAVAVVAVVALVAGVLAFSQQRRANNEAALAEENALAAQAAADDAETAAAEASAARELEAQARESADDQAQAAAAAAADAEAARDLEATERARAQHAELVARAVSLASDEPEVALLLAAEAYDRDSGAASQSALLATLGEVPRRLRAVATSRAQNTNNSCITPFGQGKFIMQLSTGLGLVDAIDMSVQPLGLDAPCQTTVSNSETLVAAPRRQGGIAIWDLEQQALAAEFDGLGGRASFVAFSPDDSQLLVGFGSEDELADRLALLDVATGEVVQEFPVDRPLTALSWAPTGQVLLQEVTEFGRLLINDLVLLDGPGGSELARIPDVPHRRPIVGWERGGARIWVGSADFSGRVIDRETGELLSTSFNRPDEAHHFGYFDPDRFVVLGYVDSGLGLTDPLTSEDLGPRIELSALALAGSVLDDDTVAVVLENGVVEVLDLNAAGGIAETSLPCCNNFGFVGASPDDEVIGVRLIRANDRLRVITPADQTIREIQYVDLGVEPGSALGALTLGQGKFQIFRFDMTSVVFDSDGTVLERIDHFPDRNVRLLTLNRNQSLVMFLLADLDVPDPTGTAPGQPELVTIDLDTNTIVGPSYPYDPTSPDVPTSFYPVNDGGAILASGASGRVALYDSSGQVVKELDLEPGVSLHSGIDPTGQRVALRRGGDFLEVLDVANLEVLHTIAQTDGIFALFVDDTRVVLTNQQGSHVLHDLESDSKIGELVAARIGRLSGASVLSTDRTSVWVTGGDERLLRVSLDPNDWRNRACELAGRDITEQEWAELVPGDAPWQPICDT